MNEEQLKNYKATESEKKAIKAAGSSDIPPGIQVKRIKLYRPMQVPGRQADEDIKAETHPNKKRWEIQFVPQIRHHRITYWDGRNDEPEIAYVHETHVHEWWPA